MKELLYFLPAPCHTSTFLLGQSVLLDISAGLGYNIRANSAPWTQFWVSYLRLTRGKIKIKNGALLKQKVRRKLCVDLPLITTI